MGIVVAVFHEAGQRQLQNLRRMAVHDAARLGEGLDQFRRQGHVAHAQAGVQGLAERAQVDGALVSVQALHAGRGQAVVVEFAVVIVLQDPLAVLGRPADQFQATFQRQGGARRVLVGRSHVDAVGAAAVLVQQVGAQALFVHGDGHDPRFGGLEGLARAEVAGVLHQDGLAGVHQQLGAQEQGLPGAAQDQDLVGRYLGAAFQVQVDGDGLAQGLGALRVAMQQDIAAIVLHGLALQAFPDIGGKVARLGQAGRERLDGLLVGDAAALEDGAAAPAQARAGFEHAALEVLRLDAPVGAAAQLRAHGLGHIAARAFPAHDEAVAMQLHVGIFHRVARHSQGLGQRARCRQLHAGVQRAVQDQGAQGALDALVKVQGLKVYVGQTHLQGVQFKRARHAVCSRYC